jgi:2-dehydropantoate 2-reductase
MGTGGVGGYFGARLAAAGHDVAFIARGAHLAAMRERGLRVESGNGELHLETVTATDDPAAVGPVDVVIFAVKLWDMETAAEACGPLLGEGTAVIPFLNGVDAVDVLTTLLGAEHTLGGVAYIASVIAAPGVIRHSGTMAKLVFGEVDGKRTPRVKGFLSACREAGFEAEVPEDILGAIWEKFIFLSAMSGVTTAARRPFGFIRDDPDGRPVFEAAMAEAAAVARARGIGLADDIVERRMTFGDGLPATMMSSMQQDLAAGRRLEAPWLSGAVSRLGREYGIATPVSDTLYAVVKPYVEGAPD